MSKNSNTIEKIFQAIRVKDLESFLKLIENSSIDEVNEYSQTFLHEAVSSNNIIVIRNLLDRKLILIIKMIGERLHCTTVLNVLI